MEVLLDELAEVLVWWICWGWGARGRILGFCERLCLEDRVDVGGGFFSTHWSIYMLSTF